jgi:hypothetical protein
MTNSRAWLSQLQLPGCYYGRLSIAESRQWFLRKREKSDTAVQNLAICWKKRGIASLLGTSMLEGPIVQYPRQGV